MASLKPSAGKACLITGSTAGIGYAIAQALKLFARAEKMAHPGVAEPGDLAALSVFLASPAASKITGQAISVNGGISAA